MKKFFLIPENLHLEDLLKQSNIKVTKIQLDKYHYLLDLIYHYTVINHKMRQEYMPINNEILESILGSHFACKIVKNLILLKILECDNRYIVGSKSKGYRFAKEYRVTFMKVNFNSNSFLNKLARIQEEELDLITQNSVLKYILKCCLECKFDLNAAINYTLSMYLSESKVIARRGWIVRLESGEQYCFQDKQGRFYTNFTMMPRDIRRFARIDGEEVYQCDYSACQPTLLASLYNKDNEDHLKERTIFLDTINNGFYKHFADQYSIKYDLNNNEEKGEFKQLLFKHYLFCKNFINSEIRNIFKKDFPILASLIYQTKFKDHADLAKNMQRLESKIVLEHIAPKLIEKDIWFITIHDCIATKLEHVDFVAQTMRECFEEVAGFGIKVKTNLVGN